MHLFLDTNIYLAFYKLSGDDLEELKKLAVTVRSHETTLYLPQHVKDEFKRNRAGTISESLRIVENAPLPKSYPRLFTNLDGYEDLRATLDLLETQRRDLLEGAKDLALRHQLHADGLIDELFAIARPVPLTDEIWSAAQTRHRLGNPPGKKDSVGDAINWESLLSAVPDGENIILVTADKDYASKLDPTEIDEFLSDEWTATKGSVIAAHDSLTALFRTHYPHIRLAADLEKELAIDELISSANFRSTHLAIQKLATFVDVTPEQAKTMFEAADANSQVRQILDDADVRAFYTALADRFADQLSLEALTRLRVRMNPADDDSADDVDD